MLLAGSLGAASFEQSIEDASARGSLRIARSHDGLVREVRGLSISIAGTPEQAAREVIRSASHMLFESGKAPEFRLEHAIESLTGKHLTFRHLFNGVEVVDSEVVVEVSTDGRIRSIRNNIAREPSGRVAVRSQPVRESIALEEGTTILDERLVGITIDGTVRVATRLITQIRPHEVYALYIDDDGSVVRRQELFFNASARVFDPDPVTTLNDPSLRDLDDSPGAVPEAGYRIVELPDLAPSGPLSGPHVRIVDTDSPTTVQANAAEPLVFDRGQNGFEEVMAYYHIDRNQRYLQSLGYTGSRQIVGEPIDVDAHGAGGADNSFFVVSTRPGFGRLVFGDGGVDDAEDADILLHEYGHAIQESIAPGAFFGARAGQGRAMGEGFGDYWAFSGNYAASVASGRDPFCVGDWDARCAPGLSTSCGYPAGADCLRRTDSPKTMSDFIPSGGAGTEHRNGEIWSSALRRIFIDTIARHGMDQGRRVADVLVLEGYFGLTSSPTFRDAATRMVDADRQLFQGANLAAICSSMVQAQILASSECIVERRGDLTLLQSLDPGRAIPDGNPAGIISTRRVDSSRSIEKLFVQVNIAHPSVQDLRLVLTAPDGRSAVLEYAAGKSGVDLQTTYGLDTVSADSLDIFDGMNAMGDWTLQVIDTVPGNAGRLVSWGLVIRFQGDVPLTSRPAVLSSRQHLLVVARAAGAAGTNFVSDVRLFNRGGSEAALWAVFTPSGQDGRDRFSAVQLRVAPGQTMSLDDVVPALFGTTGTGALEFHGDINQILITSRTYNRGAAGTFGQFIASAAPDAFLQGTTQRLHIPQLQNTGGFRSNVGVTNVSQESGTFRVTVFDAAGTSIEARDIVLPPFGHQQFPILGGLGGVETVAARAEVAVISGGAIIAAYGSVVDNVSGDSIYIPGRLAPQPSVLTVQAVFRGDGGNGTRWRTDVWLSNPSATQQSAVIVFHSADGTEVASEPVSVEPGKTLVFLDVLSELLGIEAGFGKLTISESPLIATARIWTPGASGSFGQFVAARRPSEAVGPGTAPSTAIQLEASTSFRTNTGFTELSGAPATVRVRVHDSGGNELLARDLEVPAHGQLQANLEQLGAPRTENIRASFEVVGGTGRVAAYASVVDNRTGDPIFVPAR